MSTKKTDSNLYKFVFFSILLMVMLTLVISLQRIAIPFGIAYILALMIRPLQKSFYSVGIKRKLGSTIGIFTLLFLFSYPIIQGVKTVSQEAHRIEYYIPKFETYVRDKYSSITKEVESKFNFQIGDGPLDDLIASAKKSTKEILIYLPKILASAFEWSFIIPLFVFFILKDERSLRFQFLKIVPNRIVERAYFLYHQFNTKFGDYIFAKFIEAVIVGVLITIGLLIIDFPFAFLLGIIAGITNILPYIGPILGFLPALVIGLVDQNPNTTLGAMAITYLIANIIDLALVFPILVSKIVNLHPILVVVGVILGSQLGGVLGMIVSVPLVAFFKLFFEQIYLELYGKGF